MCHVNQMLKGTNLAQGRDIFLDLVSPEVHGANMANLLRISTTLPRFSDERSDGNTGSEFG